MVTQVGYSVAGRSRGQVAMCAVCTVHIETRSAGFLVEPQIQGRQFVSGLISKPLGRFLSGLVSKLLGRFLPVWPQNQWYGFPRFDLKTGGDNFRGLASKPRVTVFRFGHQNQQVRFGDLCLKIITTISYSGSQNQADFSLSIVPQNRWREDGVGHTSRSGRLLHLKASCARVSQFDHKTGGGVPTDGACGIIMKVASREI
jgi:hypothetical protein